MLQPCASAFRPECTHGPKLDFRGSRWYDHLYPRNMRPSRNDPARLCAAGILTKHAVPVTLASVQASVQ